VEDRPVIKVVTRKRKGGRDKTVFVNSEAEAFALIAYMRSKKSYYAMHAHSSSADFSGGWRTFSSCVKLDDGWGVARLTWAFLMIVVFFATFGLIVLIAASVPGGPVILALAAVTFAVFVCFSPQ
jgi:hypothetical protein